MPMIVQRIGPSKFNRVDPALDTARCFTDPLCDVDASVAMGDQHDGMSPVYKTRVTRAMKDLRHAGAQELGDQRL